MYIEENDVGSHFLDEPDSGYPVVRLVERDNIRVLGKQIGQTPTGRRLAVDDQG